MLITGLVLILLYILLIIAFYKGFDKVDDFYLQDYSPKMGFSVIITFRNEEDTLPALLESLYQLEYPSKLVEVLFINDDSSDKSVKLIESFIRQQRPKSIWKILNNERFSGSPKKDAVRLGIQNAQFRYIATTDADVILPKYWLACFDAFLQVQPSTLIAGPVKLHKLQSFLDRYQAIDVLSLQGSTIGAFGWGHPFMCNAANMCYDKEAFLSLDPYKQNQHIASGDDVFLLEALVKYNPSQIGYIKSPQAVVSTSPVSSWNQLFHQRQRWASKAKSSSLLIGKITGVLVLLTNLWILILPLLVLLGQLNVKSALLFFLVKFSIDFLLVFKTARYLDETEVLFSFLPSSIIYPFVSVYVVLLSLLRPYTWKQRSFKS